jgi:hypothetical protein
MSRWDLSRLRYTIRKITGRYDTVQLPDSSFGENNMSNPAGIDDYINDFYLYDFPEHLRTLRLKQFYTFATVPNYGTYGVPQNVYSLEGPIYIDNYQFNWYQSPQQFYNVWPEQNFIDQNLFTPNGNDSIFTFKLTQTPIQQGSVVIGVLPDQNAPSQPIMETFRDRDQPVPLDLPQFSNFPTPGILTSTQYLGQYPPINPGITPGTGKIDYLTGQVTLSYIIPPAAGLKTSCHYHPYVPSRSRDIMFYQQQLFLRPIPNDTYLVKLMAYMMPTTVISAATIAPQNPSIDQQGNIQGYTNGSPTSTSTNLPDFNEWWQLIAYGAALKIFIEDGDHEQYEQYKVYFEQQKLLAQRKELKQLANQRIPTIYATDQNQGGSSWPIFPQY